MILSYKKQFPWKKPTDFKKKILEGVKIHTIREDPHGRWRSGKHIHHAYNVRTKKYECFLEGSCCEVQEIVFSKMFNSYPSVFIDNELFYAYQNSTVIFDKGMLELVKNDGFDSVEDFFKWFNSDFQGRIIHWTGFKY